MKKRTKRTIAFVVLRKLMSMTIGIIIVWLNGVPFHSNIKIAVEIAIVTLIVNFFFDKAVYNKIAREINKKKP